MKTYYIWNVTDNKFATFNEYSTADEAQKAVDQLRESHPTPDNVVFKILEYDDEQKE
jgi:hypothetical protein